MKRFECASIDTRRGYSSRSTSKLVTRRQSAPPPGATQLQRAAAALQDAYASHVFNGNRFAHARITPVLAVSSELKTRKRE